MLIQYGKDIYILLLIFLLVANFALSTIMRHFALFYITIYEYNGGNLPYEYNGGNLPYENNASNFENVNYYEQRRPSKKGNKVILRKITTSLMILYYLLCLILRLVENSMKNMSNNGYNYYEPTIYYNINE